MKRGLPLYLLVLAVVLLASCSTPPTPSPTPSPTDTPMPEPADLWHIVVTLDDLPSGFQEIPNEEWWGEETVAEADLNGGSLFALVEPERSQSVFGLSTFLATIAEAGAFDAILHRPTMLMEVVVGPPGESDVIEQAELEPLADIGDVSAGITVVIDMGADRSPARMDIVGFRRDDVGVTVCVMYPDGDTPIVSIQHVSRELDDRAKSGGLEPAAVTEPGPVSPPTILDGYQIAVDEDLRLSFVHPSGWVEDRGGFTVRESTATLSFVTFTIQSELGAHYKLIQFFRIDQSLGRTPETLIEQVLGVNEDRLAEAGAEILETPQGVDIDGEPASGIIYRATDPRGVRFFAILLAVGLSDSGYIFQWASTIEHEQEMKQIYEVTLPTIEFTE